MFGWAMLVVALTIVFAFPSVIAGTTLLEMERAFDWPFFIAARGGDPVLWQHLFWFFGHPEVYIIFLPAAGLVSMMIPALAGKPLVGYRAVVLALAATGLVSFALWAHHMFTAGLGTCQLMLVSAASLAVAVPTAMQVFAWLATLARGRLRYTGAALFVLGFLFIFVLGGLTGVMVAVLPLDWQVHDSYFIVAHLHYVLIGGVVFPVFAALYHWTPLLNRHLLSERLARWVFGLMFSGFNLGFFPMHVSGLLGMPRRVYTYADGLGLNLWNLLSSIGSFVFAAGVLLFFAEAIRTWLRPKQDNPNLWNAGTLEWLPSANYGTLSIPQVESRDPLWTHPGLAAEVEAGRHWLPGFFLLLTVQMIVLACQFGALGLSAVLVWLWGSDRPAARHVAPSGPGELPIGARGTRSHSWWATVVLVVVDVTIFASFLFAHLHVSMLSTVCPPPGARLPSAASVWGGLALWAVAALAMWAAGRCRLERPAWRSRLWMTLLIGAAFAAAAGAMGLGWSSHDEAGLAPRANAWSATVAALLAWQGFHVAVLAVMAMYLTVRLWSGHLTPRNHATLENVSLFWQYTVAQGALTAVIVQWLPEWMN